MYGPPPTSRHQGQSQAQGSGGARSPPPLQHPRPQHPPSQIPSQSPPPDAYAFASSSSSSSQPSSYQRFASPPSFQQHGQGQGYPVHQTYSAPGGAATPDAYIPANSTPYAPPHYQQGGGQGNVQWMGGHPTQPRGAQSFGGGAHPQSSPPPPSSSHQQQRHGWPPAMNSFGSAMGMNMDDATAQIGVQFGKQALTAGQAYLDSHFTRLLPLAHLKHSFNVSNSYVVNKIRLVLFPWRHRPWSRSVTRNEVTGVAEGWKPPRDDINCPDLYIPVMALVTYILLSGVAAGKAGTFDPSILGQSASRSFGILLLEFVCIRLGCYLLGIGEEGTVVDLVSYEGYKFVGVIVALMAGLVGASGWSFWLVFTYVVLANFFFQLRSLRHLVLPDPSLSPLDHVDPSSSASSSSVGASPTSHAQRARRIQFLFVIAAAQGLSMGVLVKV
ncbi:hypothetical protein JCM10908_003455 [Rhodotorula pacifica]|uniref:protein transporter YIF1 n=1 Tax=Rhodotorula pacifica TaxID=1495444 RepID=UPI00317DC1B8